MTTHKYLPSFKSGDKKSIEYLVLLLFVLLLFACDSGPKVIKGEPLVSNTPNVSVFDEPSVAILPDAEKQHQVVAKEALNTERYTYLNVEENGEVFWIAIPKTEVKIGATYYYKGGLLKRNFQSQEFDRVFETVYLVAGISPHPIGAGGVVHATPANNDQTNIEIDGPIKPVEGAIEIAELISNLSKYEGKLVKVTGKCTKVNPMIMGRNWVHLQDGSGENYDLTITTAENIPLGAVVSLEGTIALNRDFGAGYRYEVIMEGAELK